MATRTPPAAPAFDLATFLPYRLSALSVLTQRLLEATLARSEVTIAQWRVYLCLVTNGPSHLNGIVAFTQLPQSSLSRSIAAMHDRGLVRNQRVASDRRIARIEITSKGRRHLAALTQAIDAACANAFRLTNAEERRLIRQLDVLIGRLSAWRAREAGAAAASSEVPQAPVRTPRSLSAAAPVDRGPPRAATSRRVAALRPLRIADPGEPR